jgi:hypothetical protein
VSTDDQGKTGSLPDADLSAAFSGAAAAALAPRRRNRRGGSAGQQGTPAEPQTAAVPEDPKHEKPTDEAVPPTDPAETKASEERAEPPNRTEETPAALPKQQVPIPPSEDAAPDDAPPEPKPTADLVLQTADPVETPQPREVSAVQIRNLGEAGQRATQCTVMVSVSVRDRFAHYQLTKKMEGREPTNAVVVRRAVLHARKNDLFAQLLEKVRHRQQPVEDEDHDPDGLFGEVPGRRAERGRVKDSVQQSFRPSYQELEVIDAITAAYGFPSRSDFLDAALDAFLPPMPSGKSRGR